MSRWRERRAIPYIAIAVSLSVLLAMARSWTLGARLLPQIVSAFGIIICTVSVGKLLLARGPGAPTSHVLDLGPEDGPTSGTQRSASIATWLWVTGFLVLGLLVGLAWAMPVFLLSYLYLVTRLACWKIVAIVAPFAIVFLYLFPQFLDVYLPGGIMG